MTSKYNPNYVEREPKEIIVMDTTLRDGEQNSLCTMYPDEKIRVAKILEEMNVDIIEAGFAVSNGNYEVMREIAKTIKKPYLCGLSRCLKKDIYRTYMAYKDYDKRMIHIFVPTSKIQVDAKIKKSEEELIEISASAVKYAKKYFDIIEFTAEDSVRSDFRLLEKVYREVLNEGASVINVADTVGCAYPEKFGDLVSKVSKFVKKVNKNARVSVHCHNDLGMALANTLYAVKNGAEQVECTIYGIGERAGNCALEQIVAWGLVQENFKTKVDSSRLYEAVQIIEKVTGVRNDFAPIVGKSAYSHKSGIHQHGVINNRNCYEFLDPKNFGRKSEMVIGPHSGYHGVIAKAKEVGYNINKEQAKSIIKKVSRMVRKKIKKRFSDEDLREMIEEAGFK